MRVTLDVYCWNLCEEMAENRKVFCGSVVLGTSPDTIVSRLANKIYADCRAKKLSISQFPDYEPTIQALKSGGNRVDPNTYKVCVPQGGKLLVLQILAQKWVDQESTSTRASELIAGHNEKFNDSGEYWACERILVYIYNVFQRFQYSASPFF